ncbi:MAG: hypothetical protein IJP23_00005, partial [Oscillospiraceae bacterium]|nr:hypothetical protein [Oscillospiraceae bacterium]
MANKQELYDERVKRMQAAVNLETYDRVPIVPKMNFFYGSMYGVNSYASMSNLANLVPAVKAYIQEFQPDAVWAPAQPPLHAVDALGCNYIRCPGPDFKIGLDESFQILDGEYMYEEEYPEFCLDPTHFILTKWLPRRNKKLAGLAKLNFQDAIEYGLFASIAPFDDPEVREAVTALQTAAYHSKKWLAGSEAFYKACIEEGVPLGPTLGHTCPFDMLADNYRGMVNAVMDTMTCPDEVHEALDVMTELCIKNALNGLKAMGHKYLFIPLHNGVDEFMSKETYAEFYWPGLKKLMLAGIEAGLTPYVFCEGNYNTRLEQLCDVPKGKVIYMFEKVDMKKAKETVG